MHKKYSKEEFDKPSDLKKYLKHDFIEELKWYEEELNELFLYKNRYSKFEIKQAKHIIDLMKDLEERCIDRQLDYLIERTIKRVKKLYPEFFNSS